MSEEPNFPLPSQRPADLPTRTVEAATEHATRIGDYRIVRKLGEGGMGIVYEAEQPHLRRPVALKVIRGGRYTDEHQVRLFEREAQALARLRHPAIAAIYESGCTPDGQPFFTMELVRGELLSAYLQRQGRPRTRMQVRERLHIFSKLCDAVHYAHQRGVIHRDLKPGNIVILPDAGSSASGDSEAPGVKILDFGLARITDAELAAATVVTEIGRIQGSLAFMSPEQMRGAPDEIDVRTDVYSLGVLLYEMLCGGPPFDVSGKALHEVARIVCEDPPPRFPVAVSKCVDTDLQTIALRALEKEPARRYQSVSALAEEVVRYLAGEAILAHAPSTTYQLRKLMARHRTAVAFAATVLLFIVAFSAVTAIQARKIAAAADQARRQEATTSAVSDFLVGLFELSDPSETRGATITAREVLDRGALKAERELGEQPLIRARLQRTIAKVYQNLGLYSRVEPLLQAALASPALPAIDRADTLHALGELRYYQARYDDAAALFRQGLAMRESALGPDHPSVATSLNDLGVVVYTQGHYREAQPLYERALAIRERALGPSHELVAETIQNVATVDRELGLRTEAEAAYKRAVAIYEAARGPDSPKITTVLGNLAALYAESGRYADALLMHQRVLAIEEKALGEKHPSLAYTLRGVALDFRQLGRSDQAEEMLRRALRIEEDALGPSHPEVARTLSALALVTEDLGRAAETESLQRRALQIRAAALGPDHPEVADSLNNLAWSFEQHGQYVEAVALNERARTIRTKVYGPEGRPVADSLNHLGRLAYLRGDYAAAESLLTEALRICEKNAPPQPRRLAMILEDLANLDRGRGKFAEAEARYKRAFAIEIGSAGPSHRDTVRVAASYAVLLRKMGREEEARAIERGRGQAPAVTR